jgi:capsular polysaccharide export protein
VYDDSQLLIQDNWITDNITLVKSVIKSLQDLEIKRKIIIKEHPREFRKIDYKKILKDNDICFSTAGTIDLISESKLIVTINSTVGFEALVFCKPVLITGSALYESLPYITKVNNQADLTLKLKKYLLSDFKYDKIEITKSVSSVYNKLVKCNYVSPKEIEIKNLWQKISELIIDKN